MCSESWHFWHDTPNALGSADRALRGMCGRTRAATLRDYGYSLMACIV
jgi:hypothetical protein